MITNLTGGAIVKTSAKQSPELLMSGLQIKEWAQILERDYRLVLPKNVPTDSLPVVALHLEVSEVKYRGYYVTMVGQRTPGFYQFFTLPVRYFYKNHLNLELYDRTSGKQLAKCLVKL
jgi:hypothetical protein